MQKQQLTTEQIKLIEDNYNQILAVLFKWSMNKNMGFGRQWYPVEAASYIVDAALEYKEELSNGKEFSIFAAERCYLRLIDEYRYLNKHVRLNSQKTNIIDKLEQEVLSQKGYVDQIDISKSIEDMGLNATKMINVKRTKKQNIDAHKQVLLEQENFFVGIENEDEIKGLERKADEFFKELPGPSMEKRNFDSKVRKKLLKEYIIPKIQRKDYKNLSQIAKETNLTEGRLSQILRDENFKELFKNFYGAVDLYGKPIVR